VTREEANLVLDKVRDGQSVPAHVVDLALFFTGDLLLESLHNH